MQDNLKKHIESKREEFEIYDFEQGESWLKISDRLNPDSKPKRFINYWKYAVAACLILVTGWSAFYVGQSQNNDDSLSELSEVEYYYQNEIEAKLSLVKTMVDDPLLMADLELMDMAFADLKADLKDDVDNAEVVEAMMENYRLKLKILEKILEEISENEEDRDDSEVRL
ncbi:MAG: hypothetical protein JXR03_06005 [Cyclobacteriaceae bacterium]